MSGRSYAEGLPLQSVTRIVLIAPVVVRPCCRCPLTGSAASRRDACAFSLHCDMLAWNLLQLAKSGKRVTYVARPDGEQLAHTWSHSEQRLHHIKQCSLVLSA